MPISSTKVAYASGTDKTEVTPEVSQKRASYDYAVSIRVSDSGMVVLEIPLARTLSPPGILGRLASLNDRESFLELALREYSSEMVEAGVEAYLEWLDRDMIRQESGRLESLVIQILQASKAKNAQDR